jgi:hypothetical protein
MRAIIAGFIMLSASTSVAATAQCEKSNYVQAVIGHGEPMQATPYKIGADPHHFTKDALTRRIEQDKIRLDRLIEICSGC